MRIFCAISPYATALEERKVGYAFLAPNFARSFPDVYADIFEDFSDPFKSFRPFHTGIRAWKSKEGFTHSIFL